MTVIDLAEAREKSRRKRATVKGGCEHLQITYENNDGWVVIHFKSNGQEKTLTGVTCPRETYEKFDRDLRATMGWER